MTIRIPKGVLIFGGIALVVCAVVAAFVIGRSSGSDSSSSDDGAGSANNAGTAQLPCSEASAKAAILASDWPYLIETSPLGGGYAPRPLFHQYSGYRIAILKCVELEEQGSTEMIVALSAGAAGRVFNWAIFRAEQGDWKLAFHREAIPLGELKVNGQTIVTEQPIYGPTDALCCPRGHRKAEVIWDGSSYVVRTEAPSNERSIAVDESVGVTSLGVMDPQNATPSDAAAAFGVPPVSVRDDVICRQEWRDLGLVINFVNLGSSDPCGPEGRVGSFYVAGTAAQQAGWEAEQIKVGSSEGKVRELFPAATTADVGADRLPPFEFTEPPLTLVERPSPFGESGTTPTMRAGLQGGKIVALSFEVGAGGE